jgi:porin
MTRCLKLTLVSLSFFATTQGVWAQGLAGEWGGLKPALADRGLDLSVEYTGDFVANLAGGLEQKSGYLGNLDLKLGWDLEKSLQWTGWRLDLYALGTYGAKPTEFVGDFMASSNIEAPDAFKLYEANVTKSFGSTFALTFGLVDLNAHYYVTDSSALFRGSPFGISPTLSQTGENGPSIFPNLSVALHTRYESEAGFYFMQGVFNATSGVPGRERGTHVTWAPRNGYLLIAESGYEVGEESAPSKYALGLWSYSNAVARLEVPAEEALNWGGYALLDHAFSPRLSAFLRYGWAAPRVNTVDHAFETGATYEGLVPGRDEDVLGLGVAWAGASSAARSLGTGSSETSLEIAYRAEILEGLALTPDFQLSLDPGFNSAVDTAWIASLRLEMAL